MLVINIKENAFFLITYIYILNKVEEICLKAEKEGFFNPFVIIHLMLKMDHDDKDRNKYSFSKMAMEYREMCEEFCL